MSKKILSTSILKLCCHYLTHASQYLYSDTEKNKYEINLQGGFFMHKNISSNDISSNKMHAHNHSIKCNVNTCSYYDNNYCSANVIEVNPMGDGVAHSSEGTCCTTFVEAKQ